MVCTIYSHASHHAADPVVAAPKISAEAKVDAMDPSVSEEVEDFSVAASKAEMELLRQQLAEKRGLKDQSKEKVAA